MTPAANAAAPSNSWVRGPGSDPKGRRIRSGLWTFVLHDGDVRHLSWNGREIVNVLYVAVRDPAWATVTKTMGSVRVQHNAKGVHISYHARNRSLPLDFEWDARIDAWADGRFEWSLDGHALTTFRYARIGLNVLLDTRIFSAAGYVARGPDGTSNGVLPSLVEPQWVVDGHETGMFPPFTELVVQLEDAAAEFSYTGDLFEMEDQRNYSDACFKVYSTPLALGGNHAIDVDSPLRQELHLKVRPAPTQRTVRRQPASIVIETSEVAGRMTEIGFGMPPPGEKMSDRTAGLAAALRPAHLRLDLHASEAGLEERLENALEVVGRLRCHVECALVTGDSPIDELPRLLQLAARLPLRRLLVLTPGDTATPSWLTAWAIEAAADLGLNVRCYTGSLGFFAELNRNRVRLIAGEGVAFAATPLHRSDDESLFEALVSYPDMVATARRIWGARPISVGPITLQPDAARHPDPRQRSLLAAAWTVGSVAGLARAGADQATFYQLTGESGLIPIAGAVRVYPAYHVFADLAEWRQSELVCVRTRGAVVAVAGSDALSTRVLAANVTPKTVSVEVRGLGGAEFSLQLLDGESAELATSDPQRFRSGWETLSTPGGRTKLKLGPYAVASLRGEKV